LHKFETPYYAVIFTSILNPSNDYSEMANKMEELAKLQPGFLGVESAREKIGITVSYWDSLEAIKNWKENIEHKIAQQKGREEFYKSYKVEICKVQKKYTF
jgi:heme-degrading monooxygenase HmoA